MLYCLVCRFLVFVLCYAVVFHPRWDICVSMRVFVMTAISFQFLVILCYQLLCMLCAILCKCVNVFECHMPVLSANCYVIAILLCHLRFSRCLQLILRPWGWTTNPPPDESALANIGNQMAMAIRSVHGRTYQNIPTWQLYLASGGAHDW